MTTATKPIKRDKMSSHSGIVKYTKVKPATNLIITLVFIVLALVCFLPALFVFIISFSSEASIATRGYSFIPSEFSLSAYSYLWAQKDYIGNALINSLIITFGGTACGLFFCATMGYALSRSNYKFRKFFSIYIFIPMLFSGGMVASYMINAQVLGLKNTLLAIILPLSCSSFYVIIMRTFFQTTVPDAIIESAKIDGARQLRIFAGIVLPISLPAIATIGLFYTFLYWNDWYQSLLYLDTNHSGLYPLQYVLISIEKNIEFLTRNKDFLAAGTTSQLPSETMRMAIVMVVVLPIACSYPFFQRYFISGLTIGAVKG